MFTILKCDVFFWAWLKKIILEDIKEQNETPAFPFFNLGSVCVC